MLLSSAARRLVPLSRSNLALITRSHGGHGHEGGVVGGVFKMEQEGPSKTDITAVFKKLRSYPANKVCFDCGAKNPTWASVTYGVFICIDCSAVHRGLGVHLSFVRSTQLDTNWTWLQLRAMQVGGNSNATQSFRQHGCITTDSQQKYKSRAAQIYREKLHHSAVAAMRLHGTKVHLDSHQQETLSPVEKDVDFFEHIEEQHTKASVNSQTDSAGAIAAAIEPLEKLELERKDNGNGNGNGNSQLGPSVEGLDDDSSLPTSVDPVKTSLIGQKKPTQKKTQKGFGAQKTKANYSDIEKVAQTMEKQNEPLPASQTDTGAPQMSSRLLVQDISAQQRKVEEKLKHSDPKKGEQVERLGMALSSNRSYVSHSLANEMKSIQQEGMVKNNSGSSSNGGRSFVPDTVEDDWEMVSKEPTTNKSNAKTDDFFSDFGVAAKSQPSWQTSDENPRKSKTPADIPSSDEAQKKFGKAKAISSDQFFGDRTLDFTTKSNISRFEGSSGISSADFFNDGTSPTSGAPRRQYSGGSTSPSGGVSSVMPDMAEIGDSVRQGVTKVAGRLSQMSTNVSSYLSDRYGT